MIPAASLALACLPYLTATFLVTRLLWRIRRWRRTGRAVSAPLFPLPPQAATRGTAWKRLLAEICLLRGRRRDSAGNPAAWGFHFALLLLFIGHIRAFTDFPGLWAALSLSPGIVDRFATLAGGAAGLMALGTGLVLAARRLLLPRLRHITRLEDLFVLALLLAVILSGLAMRFGPPAALEPIRDYFAALATLSPRPMPDVPGFALHFLLAQALAVVFPFGKLLHAAGVLPAKAGLGRTDETPGTPPA